MLKYHSFPVLFLLCLLIPVTQSCRQSEEKKVLTEQEIKRKQERNMSALRLGTLLNARELDRALHYLDTLNRLYPNDPQFYFCEGWAYEMQGDSVRARRAYIRSIEIYDSLIAITPNLGDMINRACIVQTLYGVDAYNRALDEILHTLSNPKDSQAVEFWRGYVNNNKELSFSELSDTIQNYR